MPQSTAAIMSQCSSAVKKSAALVGVVAQPVEQFRKAPLRRIRSAAPIDGLKLLLLSRPGDERRFPPGPVIAPQIIFAERLEPSANRNDARTGRVDGQRRDLTPGQLRRTQSALHRLGQRAQMVVVALGGVIGVRLQAMEGIFGDAGAESAAVGIHESNAHAQRSEVHPCHNRHEFVFLPTRGFPAEGPQSSPGDRKQGPRFLDGRRTFASRAWG
jgi:hypothetical protein